MKIYFKENFHLKVCWKYLLNSRKLNGITVMLLNISLEENSLKNTEFIHEFFTSLPIPCLSETLSRKSYAGMVLAVLN